MVAINIIDVETGKYFLPAVYSVIMIVSFYLSSIYYGAYKEMKKDIHILSLSILLFAIGFDALWSFVSVYLIFVKMVTETYPLISSAKAMILPNLIILITLLNFYRTSVRKHKSDLNDN